MAKKKSDETQDETAPVEQTLDAKAGEEKIKKEPESLDPNHEGDVLPVMEPRDLNQAPPVPDAEAQPDESQPAAEDQPSSE